jgi:hypothetical protein
MPFFTRDQLAHLCSCVLTHKPAPKDSRKGHQGSVPEFRMCVHLRQRESERESEREREREREKERERKRERERERARERVRTRVLPDCRGGR